jgi:predicted DNA-binding protein YlxM (UPF0122 family)
VNPANIVFLIFNKINFLIKFLDAFDLRECAETWKTKRYPQCDEIRQVHAVLQDFDKLSLSINKILTRKRLRYTYSLKDQSTRKKHYEKIIYSESS